MKQLIILRKVITRIMLAVFIVFAGLVILLSTQTGLNLAWKLAQKFAPGQLTVASLKGNLLWHFSLTNLEYHDGDTKITIKNLDYSWNAFKLFLVQYDIREIKLNGVDVYLPAASSQSQETADSNDDSGVLDSVKTNLLRLNIKRAAISDVTVYQSNKPVYQVYDLLITRHPDQSHDLTLLTSFGKVTGTYKLSDLLGLSWTLNLVGEKINLGKLSPNVNGMIDFSLSGHGTSNHFSNKVYIDLANLSGRIEGNPLKATAIFDYDNGQFSVQDVNVKFGNATAQITGKLKDAWDVGWNVSIPELRHFAKDWRGSFYTTGQLRGTRYQPELTMQINGKAIRFADFSIQAIEGKIHTLFKQGVSDSGTIVVHNLRYADYLIPKVQIKSASWFDGKKLENRVSVILDKDNQIKSEITLPKFESFTDMRQLVKGVINIHLSDLSHFAKTLQQAQKIKSLRGSLTGKVNISGRLNKPEFIASVQLVNGSMYADKIGLNLSAINLDVNYHTGRPVTLKGSLLAGQGRLNIDGKFNIDAPQLSMLLNVHGSNLQVMDSKEYKVRITPHINLSYQNNDLFVRGTVEVPYALIAPTDFSSTVTLPSDVVIVNKKEDSAIPANLALDVDVKLGDDVHIKYQDLKTQLLGGIRLSQLPGNPPTAVGELSVRTGTYKAYGRHLQINEGRLIYTGNLLTNPGVSLRASTRVKSAQVTVGVNVNGTLDKPMLSLFSDPAGLSQGDILSYLLFGTAQSDSSAASGLALLNVAAGMAGGGDSANPLGGLTGALGLNVDTGSTQYVDTSEEGGGEVKSASTVGVGKNIGHDITIHYGIGLFQQAMTFSLRYQLSRRFIIQTETSTLENGGDILYSLESAH